MHSRGGKSNVHLDYSIHPKANLQRKMNIIIYMTEGWKESWGGQLGLYEEGKSDKRPGNIVKSVSPIFNRALIFDTTGNHWHGLPEPINCPINVTRNSLAVYYLQDPDITASKDRLKAKFSPAPWQEGDKQIEELIRLRSGVDTAKQVYE